MWIYCMERYEIMWCNKIRITLFIVIYNYYYLSKDPINDIIKNGVLGYTAALVKYLNSDYDYEINNYKYDTNENNLKSI